MDVRSSCQAERRILIDEEPKAGLGAERAAVPSEKEIADAFRVLPSDERGEEACGGAQARVRAGDQSLRDQFTLTT
jgi:hypothetical protein